MRNQIHAEAVRRDLVDGQADAVDADRTLGRDVARERRIDLELPALRARVGFDRDDPRDAVDMAGNEMPAEAIGETQ